MESTVRTLAKSKNIALVAHDHCKKALLDWANTHKSLLSRHTLYTTGTTGHLIQQKTGLTVTSMPSGPMGGDQQIGALISEGKIDVLIFLSTPRFLQKKSISAYPIINAILMKDSSNQNRNGRAKLSPIF
nr:methylglyoxal synthase [Xenorhabdus khoisanae]